MVLDTSAIVAVLRGEPDAPRFAALIEAASILYFSAVSAFELHIVASHLGSATARDAVDFLHLLKIQIVPFDEQQLAIARDAFDQYGKGRHPARLNFGDCASYALAKSEGMPLLFKGDDFSKTDIEVA